MPIPIHTVLLPPGGDGYPAQTYRPMSHPQRVGVGGLKTARRLENRDGPGGGERADPGRIAPSLCVVWDHQENKARQWHLLVRRECGTSQPSHYILSNAGSDLSLDRLAQMHAGRFFIEHAFREAKSELAMADYQVRRWDGWHHHMALVMIAMLFLVRERQRLEGKAPLLSLADLVRALRELLLRQNILRKLSITDTEGEKIP